MEKKIRKISKNKVTLVYFRAQIFRVVFRKIILKIVLVDKSYSSSSSSNMHSNQLKDLPSFWSGDEIVLSSKFKVKKKQNNTIFFMNINIFYVWPISFSK